MPESSLRKADIVPKNYAYEKKSSADCVRTLPRVELF
jgi:hypothetical protein